MTQRRISIVDTTQQVAFFLIQNLDRHTCNASITSAHTIEGAMKQARRIKVDLIDTDRRRLSVRGLDIARPFIVHIHLFTYFVQEAVTPSPNEHVLTTEETLRNLLTSHPLHQFRVPLTHSLNYTVALNQEGDTLQDDLARDPHVVCMWNISEDLNQPGEGPIKEFPGYLQTFNLHHIPP